MFSSTLTTLTTNLCTIVFQLLAYQKEFFAKFSKNFNDILTLIKNINFRSAIVKSKDRQIKVTSNDNDLSAFFSSKWIIDKIILRRTIKQFLLNIKEYQQILQKSNSHSQSFILSFTGNKSIQLSLTSLKHVKNNFSSSGDISIVWSTVSDIFQNPTETAVKNNSSSSDDISIVWPTVFDIFQNPTETTMTELSSTEQTVEHIEQSVLSNLDLTQKQMQALSNTIITTIDTKINRLENEFRQLLQFHSQFSQQQRFQSSNLRNDIEDIRSSKNWIVEEVEFFDSTTKESKSIINLKKHVFYKNIYAFVDRLKDVAIIRENDKIKNVISQCLRDTVLIWHFTKLSDIEKEIYREMSLIN